MDTLNMDKLYVVKIYYQKGRGREVLQCADFRYLQWQHMSKLDIISYVRLFFSALYKCSNAANFGEDTLLLPETWCVPWTPVQVNIPCKKCLFKCQVSQVHSSYNKTRLECIYYVLKASDQRSWDAFPSSRTIFSFTNTKG